MPRKMLRLQRQIAHVDARQAHIGNASDRVYRSTDRDIDYSDCFECDPELNGYYAKSRGKFRHSRSVLRHC